MAMTGEQPQFKRPVSDGCLLDGSCACGIFPEFLLLDEAEEIAGREVGFINGVRFAYIRKYFKCRRV